MNENKYSKKKFKILILREFFCLLNELKITSLLKMYSIEKVPYLETGLPGFLTAHAVQIHVQKHHQAYVDTANKLVPASEFKGNSIEEILWSISFNSLICI